MIQIAPGSTLFPYTTLFRSYRVRSAFVEHGQPRRGGCGTLFYFSVKMMTRLAGENRFRPAGDRKSTRLNSSHVKISYAVFCLKKKKASPNSTPEHCRSSHTS